MSDGLTDAYRKDPSEETLIFGEMFVIGYASIRSIVFNWDQPGLNIIQAPNGSGKTQLLNALSWALFGKPLKGSVTPWEHIRDRDYRGTMVEVNFTKGHRYQVIRCKDYKEDVDGAKGKNRLIIKENGKNVGSLRDKKDYQAWLEKTMGYSFELFKNSIIFGQKLKRLISETGPNKKKVFDEAFEVEYIPKARKIVDLEKKKAFEGYQTQQRISDKLSDAIDSLEIQLERENEIVATFEENKQKDIKREQDEIDALKEAIKDLKEKLQDEKYQGLQGQIDIKQKGVDALKKTIKDEVPIHDQKRHWEFQLKQANKEQIRINNSIKDTEDLIEHLPEKCSQCNKKYTPPEKTRERSRLKKILVGYQDELTNNTNFISGCNGHILEAANKLSSISKDKELIDNLNKENKLLEELLQEYQNKVKKIEQYNDEIKKYENRIELMRSKELDNKVDSLKSRIAETRAKYLNEKKNLRKFHKDYKIKEWLMNDPLSNSGLKAFIFNQMLDKINDRLDYYSKFVGFQVVFDINMDSANKDLKTFVFWGENPVPYDDLSGGQQQSVDVASAFAIHDVVNDGRKCNILAMDEIFESLDKNNIEIVSELIQDKVSSKALYLITHRSEFSPTNANIIKIHYKEGITSLS